MCKYLKRSSDFDGTPFLLPQSEEKEIFINLVLPVDEFVAGK